MCPAGTLHDLRTSNSGGFAGVYVHYSTPSPQCKAARKTGRGIVVRVDRPGNGDTAGGATYRPPVPRTRSRVPNRSDVENVQAPEATVRRARGPAPRWRSPG